MSVVALPVPQEGSHIFAPSCHAWLNDLHPFAAFDATNLNFTSLAPIPFAATVLALLSHRPSFLYIRITQQYLPNIYTLTRTIRPHGFLLISPKI